ncbi:hypothetical protein AMTRI_Chr01g132440 [Amborella trichopoda]|uniref:Pentacotripeptide-repeat region of PRORP domain-containing protein n=2 Tax=Amborella trichopoda TaxID=13333 RepID=W1NNV8_AMBTC|nr:pentatricopeptide repeat-containing protein At5g14080 isoform X1 [Amborella trichopoda]ERM97656.1 hypothetical protein AMTR_s00130p00076680 [Amborella trichopoda]|eukprot:XP_020517759.1 pentatricopeptide repeat-containing protein At5g14080 isoform X1 [Amborella trichopoda]
MNKAGGRLEREAAKLCNALIRASRENTNLSCSWHPSLEQTLHTLGCRATLSPSLVARVISPGLLRHHSLALGFFNWASQQPGFSHSSESYQSLFTALSLSKNFRTIDSLFKHLKLHRTNLKPSAYSAIISAQLIAGMTREAYSTFSETERLDYHIDPKVCNSLLAGLSSDGFLNLAEKVFQRMRYHRMGFTNLGFGVFVGKFSGFSDMEKTLGILDEVHPLLQNLYGSVVAFLIVDGLCRAHKAQDAWWILEELRIRGLKPDFISYRVIAEAFRKMGSLGEAEKVLKQKRKLGVAPRAHEYGEFMLELIQERRIQEAKQLGEAIINGNFPIEDDILNSLVCSVSSVDPSASMFFCKSMVLTGRFPTLPTLSTMSKNLCKHGKTEEMWNVFQMLDSRGYFSNTESYSVMVSFLCEGGRVKEAYEVLRQMKKNGHGPDVVPYNSLMEALCKEELVRPARRLWDEMFGAGCRPDSRTYSILIIKFLEMGQVEEAQLLFDHMVVRDVTPDIDTYKSLIKGLCHESKIDEAYEVFCRSLKHGLELGASTLNTLILSLCEAGNCRVASRVIISIAPSDMASCISHAVLLKSLVEGGELEMAIDHVKWIRDHYSSAVKSIFAELIACVSSSPRPGPIIGFLRELLGRGLVPDSGTWSNLLQDPSLDVR